MGLKNKSAILLWAVMLSMPVSNLPGQTLPEYLRLACENNPGLRSEYRQYLAALERSAQVRALPDPLLTAGLLLKPAERYMGDQLAEIQLMQMIPWFGTLRAAAREMELMAGSRFQVFLEARNILVFQVRKSWFELFLLEKEITLYREHIAILQSLERIALERFAGAETGRGMVDSLRLSMEIRELESELALLEDSLRVKAAEFNQLLNREISQRIVLPETLDRLELPGSLEEIKAAIQQNNPELKMLEKEAGALKARESMSRAMGLPMVGLGIKYEIFRKRPGAENVMTGKNMLMPMISLSVPLWRKKINAAVNEARILESAIQDKLQQVRRRLEVGFEEARRDLLDADRRIRLFYELVELTGRIENIMRAEYVAAEQDFSDVLGVRRKLLDLRLSIVRAEVDWNKAAARLIMLLGVDLSWDDKHEGET